jgi:SOS regulatory protein LexA
MSNLLPGCSAVHRFLDRRTIVRYRKRMADDGQYLAKLRDYYSRHRVLPSYSRIGSLVGLSSKASVAGMVVRLKAEGFLESSPDRRLKPGPRFFDRPVAESVRAGAPMPAADSAPEALSIDARLIANPSRTVLVKVKGDSMIDAGIHDGDTVVVEKRFSAEVGDIVVAVIDNEFTLKRYSREKGRVVLRPENKAYPAIRPKGNAEIFGVVVGLFRTYR